LTFNFFYGILKNITVELSSTFNLTNDVFSGILYDRKFLK